MVQVFKESQNYNFYKFNREELDKVKIDLTFVDANKNNMSLINRLNSFESPSQQAVEFVKNFVLCFPEIRPLILVLKRLLQLEKLNSSFNGGMSSFGLFLIIFAFLKLRKCNPNHLYNTNLGNLLLDFLDFYSNFNFLTHFIDVNSAKYYFFN
jgi:DNA polymerase sigma